MCQEHFIKRMTEKAYEQARIDQRKNVTLKDMCRSGGLGFRLHMEIQLIKPFLTSATAIKNYPEFEFLSGKPFHPSPQSQDLFPIFWLSSEMMRSNVSKIHHP